MMTHGFIGVHRSIVETLQQTFTLNEYCVHLHVSQLQQIIRIFLVHRSIHRTTEVQLVSASVRLDFANKLNDPLKRNANVELATFKKERRVVGIFVPTASLKDILTS